MKRASASVMATAVAMSWLIVAGGFPVAAGKDDGPPVEVKGLADSLNKFTWDVYPRLRSKPGNHCFSPVAIANSLTLVAAGARGRTADQLFTALHLNDRRGERTHEAMRQLSEWLKVYSGQAGCELHLAVALWTRGERNLQPGYVELGRKFYGAEFHRLAHDDPPEKLRQRINQWAERQTKGKITQLLVENDLDADIPLLLTSANYFQANWKFPFDQRLTQQQDFVTDSGKTVRVAMMHGMFWLPYYADEQVQLVLLPYSCTGLNMAILMPRGNQTELSKLEQSLQSESLQRWLSRAQVDRVELSLPRFQVQGSYRLEHVLAELGCKDVFTPGVADLSGITGNRDLYVGRMWHKALTTVSEQGTEAAAATTVEFKAVPVAFRVNRPFLFLIMDIRSGLILFAGRVVNPLG
jgi:serpin B